MIDAAAAKYEDNAWFVALPTREKEIILYKDLTSPLGDQDEEESMDMCCQPVLCSQTV